MLPKNVALTLIGTNTVSGTVAKLSQIAAIVKSGNSGNVSFATYFFNGLSSASRLSSFAMTGTGEMIIKLNFWISVLGNIGVMAAIVTYRGGEKKKV